MSSNLWTECSFYSPLIIRVIVVWLGGSARIAVLLVGLGVLLLYTSIALDPHDVVEIIVNNVHYIITLILLLSTLIFLKILYFNKRTSTINREEKLSKTHGTLEYELLPVKGGQLYGQELVSFLISLVERDLQFSLKIARKQGEHLKLLLNVDVGEANVQDVDNTITSMFRVLCRNWSIRRFNGSSRSITTGFFRTLKTALVGEFKLSNITDFINAIVRYIPSQIVLVDELPIVRKPLIPLGLALNIPNRPIVGLNMNHLERHIAIFGATGYGKTTTATIISCQVARLRLGVIVFDWHNEYYEIISSLSALPQTIRVKKWRPGGRVNGIMVNPFDNTFSVDYIVDVLEEVLDLTPPQSYYLEKILYECGHNIGAFSDLIEAVENWPLDYSLAGKEAKLALLRKLYILKGGDAGRLFSENNVANILNNGVVNIVELGHIRRSRLRRIFAYFLLKTIIDYHVSKGPSSLKRIIVIDEAHNIFSNPQSLASRLLPEVRKYGLGFVIVSQSPSAIPHVVMENTSTRILHTIMSGMDKKTLNNIYDFTREYYDELSRLDKGKAFLLLPELSVPILVETCFV